MCYQVLKAQEAALAEAERDEDADQPTEGGGNNTTMITVYKHRKTTTAESHAHSKYYNI